MGIYVKVYDHRKILITPLAWVRAQGICPSENRKNIALVSPAFHLRRN